MVFVLGEDSWAACQSCGCYVLRVTHAHLQEIDALDLYCGMGGLSYIDKEEGNIKIHTKWAVDNTKSMAEAFKANYPSTHVNC